MSPSTAKGPRPCEEPGCKKVAWLEHCETCRERVCLDCYFDSPRGHSKETCVPKPKVQKKLVLPLLVFLALLSGRHRPAPELVPKLLYLTPDAELLVLREMNVEYQLGPGLWVRIPLEETLVEGDCLRVWEDVGLRMRQCYAEWPTSCSDPAVHGFSVVSCGKTVDFL